MKKIPTLFVRDLATNRKDVLPELTPGCEWVLAGEGVPTRKYDGTCVAFLGGVYCKRQERKESDRVGEGPGFFVTHDPTTTKSIYWVPVGDGPEDRWHRAGLEGFLADGGLTAEGTYELVGPKINGNPERLKEHTLIDHATAAPLYDVRRETVYAEGPPSVEGLFRVLRVQLTTDFPCEGIVWHHPDGRMAKLKKRDFPR